MARYRRHYVRDVELSSLLTKDRHESQDGFRWDQWLSIPTVLQSSLEIYTFISLGLILENSDREGLRHNSDACLKKSIVDISASKCENQILLKLRCTCSLRVDYNLESPLRAILKTGYWAIFLVLHRRKNSLDDTGRLFRAQKFPCILSILFVWGQGPGMKMWVTCFNMQPFS